MTKIILFLILTCTILFSSQMGTVSGLDPNGDGFLSIRDNPQGKRIGKLYNGNKVHILDKNGNWYKIKVTGSSLIGWSHSKWIIIQSKPITSFSAGYYKVDIQELNIRNKPGKHGRIVGTVKDGEIIYFESFTGKWGKSSRGWISGKHLMELEDYRTSKDATNKSTNTYNSSSESHSTVANDEENIIDTDDSSFAWWKIVLVLIVLGIFFSYWQIILGVAITGFIGYLILASLGINLWYLGIVVVITIGLIVYYNCSGEKCPECKTCIKEYSQRDLIEQHYKHATKTGAADKRFSDNPLISTYNDTYRCTNEDCGHTFYVEKTIMG